MTKRVRPSWNESFMFSAYWAATRSSCQYLQTGSVIVRDKRIIAAGYNGAPPGVNNCLEIGCRKDKYKINFETKGKGVCRGLHAEVNAMSQISRDNLKETSLYTRYLPCSVCAKEIAGNGLKEVYYSEIYQEEDQLTKELFEEKKIELIHLELDMERCFNILRAMNK